MPDYTIRDPQSGRTIKVRGESPPTEEELGQLFAATSGSASPPARPAEDIALRPVASSPRALTDAEWAAMPAADKMRNMLEWSGKSIAGAFGMGSPGPTNPGREAVANPKMTLATAAIPIVAKPLPGMFARGLGISATRAGQNIQGATQAAKGAPVNAEKVGQEALRAIDLQSTGASMPRAVSRFIQRVTDPAKGELTFEEARDFYSNLSRLSAKDTTSLNPVMQRQVTAMRKALNDALVESAETVGKGQQYAKGIKEYRRAAQAAEFGQEAAKVGKQVAKYGAAAAGLGALGKIGIDLIPSH